MKGEKGLFLNFLEFYANVAAAKPASVPGKVIDTRTSRLSCAVLFPRQSLPFVLQDYTEILPISRMTFARLA